MAARFQAGGRLFTFGNGGSATDAASIAALFATPPHGRAVPARNLAEDLAVVTALGNDVGFDLVFSRQIIAHGREGDIALGVSTSGGSRNVLIALGEAHARGMLTLGLAGYGGGELARADEVDHCVVVDSDSVHRIQETQAGLACALWEQVQERLERLDG
jgi:D-sedoheptulose 7-phosphate isomerase